MIRIVLTGLLICFFGSPSWAQNNEAIAVIVHPDNRVEVMDVRELRRIFLGKRKTFADGRAIHPITQLDSSIAEPFNQTVVRRSTIKLQSYWSKMLFSGGGNPPVLADNDQAVKALVTADSEAIGYIRASAADASVKVILTIDLAQ